MKSLNLLLAGLLVVGLASCGGSKPAEGTMDSVKDTVAAAAPVVDTAAKADTAAVADTTKK